MGKMGKNVCFDKQIKKWKKRKSLAKCILMFQQENEKRSKTTKTSKFT